MYCHMLCLIESFHAASKLYLLVCITITEVLKHREHAVFPDPERKIVTTLPSDGLKAAMFPV